MSGRRVRRVVSGIAALAVVLATVYVAAALTSPVPRLVVDERLPAAASGSWADAVPLPTAGATAVLAGGGDAITAGDAEPRPIAGAAKLVLIAVALAAEPLAEGSPGPAITIDQAAVDRYRELDAAGARTVPVVFGQTWTRRDLIAATLLGSGNNIAELLIDEVFGGPAEYLAAAADWLDENGLTATTVADGAGLDPASRSTATELAAIARLALAEPVVADLVAERPRSTSGGAAYSDEAAFLRDSGARGLVRSYTDAAGVCIVTTLDVNGETVITVLLGQPGYPQAEQALSALLDGVQGAIREVEVIPAGQTVAVARSDWGQQTELITVEPIVVSTLDLAALELRIDAAPRSTIVRGADAGELVAVVDGAEVRVRLESTGAITEPGVAWRFADPFTVLSRWTG
jgi:D-alanyl-D-alanine carboxypeptidase